LDQDNIDTCFNTNQQELYPDAQIFLLGQPSHADALPAISVPAGQLSVPLIFNALSNNKTLQSLLFYVFILHSGNSQLFFM